MKKKDRALALLRLIPLAVMLGLIAAVALSAPRRSSTSPRAIPGWRPASCCFSMR